MGFDKKHALFIGAIALITIIALYPLFSFTKTYYMIHYWDSSLTLYNEIGKQISGGSMYLWNPAQYTGNPLLGNPETFFISLPLLLLLVLQSPVIAINMTLIISFFLLGLGMYLLAYEIKKSYGAAMVAASVFMLSNSIIGWALRGNVQVIAPLSMLPFIFLFTFKAAHSKDYIKYSIFAALLAALQIHTGGMIIFLYTFMLCAGYILFNSMGKNFSGKIVKASIIIVLLIILTLGLSAAKLLPSFKFQETSSRSERFSYQEFLGGRGHYIDSFDTGFNNLVRGKASISVAPMIGFLAILLAALSFREWKSKKVLFFAAGAIIPILLASDTFVTVFAYKFVPLFANLKNIDRTLVIFTFSISILAGFGYMQLESLAAKMKKFRLDSRILLAAVLILLVLELNPFHNFPDSIEIPEKGQVPILNKVVEDKDTFRVHYFQTGPFELSDVVGSHGSSMMSLYNLGLITGGGTVWPVEIGNYLIFAGQQNSAKLWGMLNVKYLLSDAAVDIPGTKLVEEFEPCKICTDDLRSRTHLYRNLEFVPRYYFTENPVLIIADNKGIVYSLIADAPFNPKNSAIIWRSSLAGMTDSELKGFKAVILAKNLAQEDISMLKIYSDSNGKIIPDIFRNKNSISPEDITALFSGFDGNAAAVNPQESSPNRIVFDVSGKEGYLILSETFYNFDGWKAYADGREKEIMNADGAISAVYIEKGSARLELSYEPMDFRNGLVISSLAAAAIMAYFAIVFIKNKKSLKKDGIQI